MEASNATVGRLGRRSNRNARTGPWLALAMLWFAGTASPSMAAEPMSSLGAAFRPQAAPAAPVTGGAERSNSNSQGLRVIVSGASGAVASIDGRTVHVGDIVNEMRVTQITLQGVVLTADDGTQERLTINPAVVKRMRPSDPKRDLNGVSR